MKSFQTKNYIHQAMALSYLLQNPNWFIEKQIDTKLIKYQKSFINQLKLLINYIP